MSSSNIASVEKTANWSAAQKLSALATPATSRNIVVGKAGATANPVASSFTWSAIDSTLQTHLAKITPGSSADALAQDRLNYLRGDKSKEGSPFRRRTKLLGDIVNSGIVYSGAPTGNVGPSGTYAGFLAANAGRTAAIFVGANDGMLHAFNAGTGDELFGYIPSWMGPKLAALTNPDYNNNHQSYVDATPTVAEAQVGSAGDSSDWKTVLVSGNRLQGGSINATTGAVTVPAFTWGRAATDTDATQRSGWMIDFAGTGERMVNSATVAGDNLIFGSLIPITASSLGPCPQAGGGGKSYVINIDSGQQHVDVAHHVNAGMHPGYRQTHRQ